MAERLETRLGGLALIEPRVHGDSRGFFVETYARGEWEGLGVDAEFVQQNHSRSSRGTLRGLHFQTTPGQAKLLRCARGRILDVAVDLRRASATYGQHVAVTLDAENGEQLFIPHGFAHGFCTLTPDTMVAYKVDAYYSPVHDRALAWNDPEVGIDWPVSEAEAILSDKDKAAPRLSDLGPVF